MPALTLIDQAELERTLGAGTVARLCTDDGGATPDPEVVDGLILQASQHAAGILYAGFQSEDKIRALCEADASVRGHICRIWADLAAYRRPALLNDRGETPYTMGRKMAEEHLKRVSQAEARAIGEASAGINENIDAETNRPEWDPIFAATSEDPQGPGGF
jgi:hypothetical protein